MRTFKLVLMLMALSLIGKMYSQQCSTYVQPPNTIIKNGGMEYYTWNCSQATTTSWNGIPFSYSCCLWTQPTSTGTPICTPDYFNTCAPTPTNTSAPNNSNAGLSVNANINWQNFMNTGTPTAYIATSPHSGNGYSGIAVWQNNQTANREYISTQLVSTLQPNWIYNISMWVRLSPNSAYGIQDLSVLFSNTLPQQSVGQSSFMLPITPGPGDLLVAMSSSVITDKNNWTYLTVSVPIPAGSSFNYITIGNFLNNSSTIKTGPLPIGNPDIGTMSYYYIDDVSIDVEYCVPEISLNGSTQHICEGTGGSLAIQYPTVGSFNMVITDLTNNVVIYNNVATSNFPVSPTVTTTYQVTITNANNPGCSATAYFTVNVIPPPDATFMPWFVGNALFLTSGVNGNHTWEVWVSNTGNEGTYTYLGTYNNQSFQLVADYPCFFIKHTVTNDCGTSCKAMSVCNTDCDWQPCVLPEPINLNYDVSTQQFTWDPVPGADHYVIEIILNDPSCCTSDIGTGPIMSNPNRSITTYTNSYTLNYPVDMGNVLVFCFSWRVLAVCPNGASTASASQCANNGEVFRGQNMDPENTPTKGITAARIFPNPTTGIAHVEIETDTDIEFNIQVFDLNGKLVKTFSNMKSTGKRTVVDWDTESLSKGAYMVSITTSDHQMINQTIILK